MSAAAIPSFDEFVKSPKAGGVPTFDEFTREAPPQRVGGQKVLDYANDTLSNIPGSAAKLAGNVGHALLHPIDTAESLLNVGTGVIQKMNPASVPPPVPGGTSDKRPYADAAGQALKDRYGSVDALANTIRTDPVGAAADASAVVGGVSGLARGVGAVVPSVAGGAAKVADAAGAVSDAINPINAVTKPVGAAMKAVAKPIVKSALGLPGKTERYGATPATAALEQTSGIAPKTIQKSATVRLGDLNKQLDALDAAATAAGATVDLTPARQVITDAIAKVQSANGEADALLPMQRQLTEGRPGFAGSTTMAGDVAPQQDPAVFRSMKRQFGDDFTRFDAAVPLKDSVRKVGNQAYHQMAVEANRAVPGSEEVNQQIQSLIPVQDAAQRTAERAGPVQRSIDRATRPTGGLAATLFGLHKAGIPGAVAAMTVQEALASPTARMALARSLYGGGKTIQLPGLSRTLNAAGVEGEASDGSTPRFAKGGIAGLHGEEKVVVGDGGEPEAIIPLSHIRAMGPQAQRHLLRGIGSHLGIGRERRRTGIGAAIADRNFQEKS